MPDSDPCPIYLFFRQKPQLHRHCVALVVLLDVVFLHRAAQIGPTLLAASCIHCFTSGSSLSVPPSRAANISFFSARCKKRANSAWDARLRRGRIVASEIVVIFCSHAIAIDESDVAVFSRQGVEVASAHQSVKHGLDRAHARRRIVGSARAAALVCLPVGILALYRAVLGGQASVTASEGLGERINGWV